jgi:uncharacterized membrane protein (DUF2068 family)
VADIKSLVRARHVPSSHQPSRKAIQLVAALEALKGIVVLLAASGLLALMHHDLHAIAAKLIEHAHLNPASHYPKIFLDAADHLTDSRLKELALGAALYSVLRLLEGYGLFRERIWAELLAALSGTVYIPFEMAALWHDPTLLSAGLLILNVGVVALMVIALNARRKAATLKAEPLSLGKTPK